MTQHYALVETVAPEKEAVSLDAVKDHLRITHTHEDATILGYLRSAERLAEHQTGRSLIRRTHELYLDAFPCERYIELPKPPLISVNSVQYQDDAGTWQTMTSADYIAVLRGLCPRVALLSAKSWPSPIREVPQAVRVTYVAGYGDNPDDVPEAVRTWIKMLVGSMHENREADAERAAVRLEFVAGLLDPYRVVNVR